MKNILILENGRIIKNMFGKLTESKNYKILNHFSISGYLEDSNMPDLIIADLTSIKNKKVELLMKLKTNSVISMVPFLLIISEDKEKNDLSPVQDYYLNKPFTSGSLFSMIDNIFLNAQGNSPW